MKNIYLIVIIFIIFLIILSVLFLIDIPSPSKFISEDYTLEIK